MDLSLHPLHLLSSPASTDNVVFALAGDSRDKAMALFDERGFPDVPYQWLNHAGKSPEEWEEALLEVRPTVLVIGWGSRGLSESFARHPDSGLRYVCHLAGTVREFVPRSLIERGVLVSNWGSSISHTVAEHAILLALAALRSLPRWAPYLQEWPTHRLPPPRRAMQTRSLRGKRVGLHGFGAVARELVVLLEAFGAKVSAYSLGVPVRIFTENGVHQCANLEELFATSEVIIECEALTPATQGSVNEKLLRLLPEGAAFINVARGALVDEAALARVAPERGLRLALDVYEREPLPLDSSLFSLPDTVLSPHIAGPTEDSFPAMWDFAMRNISQFLAGGEIEGLVTPEVYDRCT